MRSNRVIQDGDQAYEVIERQEALAPHPNPSQNGRLVPFAGITRILVQNESGNSRDGVECDECGRVFWADSDQTEDLVRAALSARGHAATHSENHGKPLYPRETLAKIIRSVRQQERRGNERGKCMVVAEQLNREGIPTLSGVPWTPQAVSQLYCRWRDEIKVRVPRTFPDTRQTKINGKSVGIGETVRQVASVIESLGAEIKRLDVVLREMSPKLREVLEQLEKIEKTQNVDPEVIEKAKKYDAMRGLLS
jgi:cellobiose-specific phosphotransferase system component IIB